jgi:hypothetical protein
MNFISCVFRLFLTTNVIGIVYWYFIKKFVTKKNVIICVSLRGALSAQREELEGKGGGGYYWNADAQTSLVRELADVGCWIVRLPFSAPKGNARKKNNPLELASVGNYVDPRDREKMRTRGTVRILILHDIFPLQVLVPDDIFQSQSQLKYSEWNACRCNTLKHTDRSVCTNNITSHRWKTKKKPSNFDFKNEFWLQKAWLFFFLTSETP